MQSRTDVPCKEHSDGIEEHAHPIWQRRDRHPLDERDCGDPDLRRRFRGGGDLAAGAGGADFPIRSAIDFSVGRGRAGSGSGISANRSLVDGMDQADLAGDSVLRHF